VGQVPEWGRVVSMTDWPVPDEVAARTEGRTKESPREGSPG